MSGRVLIVEDEMLIGLEIEATVEDLGLESIGIAADTRTALDLASHGPDIALVDLNLRDGLTGPKIGETLARDMGITVVFVTANPRLVSQGEYGALGVVEKPVDSETLSSVISYALNHHYRLPATPPAMFIALPNSAAELTG